MEAKRVAKEGKKVDAGPLQGHLRTIFAQLVAELRKSEPDAAAVHAKYVKLGTGPTLREQVRNLLQRQGLLQKLDTALAASSRKPVPRSTAAAAKSPKAA